MRQLMTHGLFLLLALSGSASADRLDRATDEACECMKEPYALVEEAITLVKAAQASGDFASLMKYQEQMMGVVNAGAECLEDLRAKYPDLASDPSVEKQFGSIMQEKCPNPVQGQFGPIPGRQ